jgi:hypothetical protein
MVNLEKQKEIHFEIVIFLIDNMMNHAVYIIDLAVCWILLYFQAPC